LATCPGCQTRTDDARCHHCGVALRPGSYAVHRVVGETDHSRVYQATSSTGQQVALKELTFSRLPTAQTLSAFEQEVRILRSLKHKQIPDFVDSFQDGEGVNLRLYLAQEFIAGHTLLEIVEEHRLDEAHARKIAHQLLRILIYLQSVSPPVFHRDIKPANVVLRRNGKLVLVDFGAARDTGITVGATQVGTFGYMAPEQLTGIVGKSTDLYGLGATLVHLLARRPPWELDRADVDKVVNTSRRFRSFLLELWCMDPRQRLPDARTAFAALKRARPQRKLATRRTKRGPSQAAWPRKGDALVAKRDDAGLAVERFTLPPWRRKLADHSIAAMVSLPTVVAILASGSAGFALPVALIVHGVLYLLVSEMLSAGGGSSS